jgi:hypothetical protein
VKRTLGHVSRSNVFGSWVSWYGIMASARQACHDVTGDGYLDGILGMISRHYLLVDAIDYECY